MSHERHPKIACHLCGKKFDKEDLTWASGEQIWDPRIGMSIDNGYFVCSECLNKK